MWNKVQKGSILLFSGVFVLLWCWLSFIVLLSFNESPIGNSSSGDTNGSRNFAEKIFFSRLEKREAVDDLLHRFTADNGSRLSLCRIVT